MVCQGILLYNIVYFYIESKHKVMRLVSIQIHSGF